MIKHTYKVLLLSLLHIVCAQTNQTNQMPGLLAPQYAHTIKATDFQNGPVVIDEPGYYVLSQDIVFNPASSQNSNNKEWKAALIILADCVTLDLNTHGIGQDRSYSSSNFKLIQLGGTNIYSQTDTTEHIPKQITIKNGCLNESEGYGIYGKDNSNIQIYDLNICSCDKAGIFLQSAQCSKIENVCITGSINASSNAYGIFLRDNSAVPEWTSNASGTKKSSSIELNNIKVCDITTTNTDNIDALIDDLLQCADKKIDTTQLTSILACPSTGFSASVYTTAQLIVSNMTSLKTAIAMAISMTNATTIGNALTAKNTLQTNVTALLNAINALSNPTTLDLAVQTEIQKINACLVTICKLLDEALLITNNSNNDYINTVATTTAWNAYGIRITNAQGIECNNCSVTNIHTPSPQAAMTYATGIALESCFSCNLHNCNTNNSSVDNGVATGFFLGASSESNAYSNCNSSHHTSNNKTYAYWIHQAHSNNLTSCNASANTGATEAKGFYLELCNANHFNKCKASYHSCSLAVAGDTAEAIGFDSNGGTCNLIDHCESYNMTADTNNLSTSYQASLLAVGFRLHEHTNTSTSESNSVITNSTSRCHQGSRGIAAGIMLDNAACSTLRKNTVSTNLSNITTNLGNGYGIYDTALDTSALIIENLAYANQTSNYKVSYSLANEQLPVVTSTYGDMTSLYVASSWQNISLHANPGSTGCNEACSPSPEQ